MPLSLLEMKILLTLLRYSMKKRMNSLTQYLRNTNRGSNEKDKKMI